MKIAICSDAYLLSSNTSASHAALLQKGFAALGHNVKVITSDLESDVFYDEQELVGIPARASQNSYGQSARFISIAKAISALDAFSPDVVQIESLTLLGWRAARYAQKRNIPIVTTVFGLSEALGTAFTGITAPLCAFLYKRYAQKILSASSVITAFTKKLESELLAIGIDKKLIEIPCCADAELFGADIVDPTKVQKFRMKLGLGATKTGILYAGPLDQTSNLEALMEIWAGSVKPADNLQLVIAGSGLHPDELMEMAKIRGVTRQLSFAGEVEHEDMPALYCACDAFISTSLSTSVHMAPAEAMACGLPVLLKQGCANADLLIEGRNGFTFTNSNQLKKILLSLAQLDTSGKRLLRKLVSSTVRNMDQIAEAEAFEEIYRNLLSGGKTIRRTARPAAVPTQKQESNAIFDYDESYASEKRPGRVSLRRNHASQETGFGDDYFIGSDE